MANKRYFLVHTDGTDEILDAWLASVETKSDLIKEILENGDELDYYQEIYTEETKREPRGDAFDTWLEEYILGCYHTLEITDNPHYTEKYYERLAEGYHNFCWTHGQNLDHTTWQSVLDILETHFILAKDIKW